MLSARMTGMESYGTQIKKWNTHGYMWKKYIN